MKKLLTFSLIALFILSGCEAIIEVAVSLKELKNPEIKGTTGDIYVEITSCSDYNDSRKPSDDLIDIQQKIPWVFNGAQYVECFSKEMQSYAQFSIPIAFDRTDDGQSASGGKNIELVSTDSVLLGVTIPEEIKGKLDKIKEDSFGMIDFDDFTVQIKVENDTESDYPFGVFASYIDEEPYQYENLTSLKGKSFIVRMSDVAVDHAMIKGSSVVLMPSGG